MTEKTIGKNKKIIFILSISILSVVLSLFINSARATWKTPTEDPAGGNVNPPVFNNTQMDVNTYAVIDNQYLTISGELTLGSLANCNTIDTDAEGKLVCGTDETGSGTIPANSIDSSHIIDESLTANDLGPNSVGSSEVIDNSLTANDLADGSVGTSEIISSQVQRRVSNSCSRGISSIGENGAVSCTEGNTNYEGAGSVLVPSGRYLVNITGRAGTYDGNEDDVKVEAASPCGLVTQYLSGYPLDEGITVTPSFVFILSCSTCATQALQDMCGMMGFTLRGYTDFMAAGCNWLGMCWNDTIIPASKITAIRLN